MFFSGHFFSKKIQKKFGKFFKGEKFFKMFFWIVFQKKCPETNFFLSVKKISALKKIWKFSKFFLNFFSKKVSWKKTFFECQNHFQNFFPMTFGIFLNIFSSKKVSAKLSVFKIGQFWLCPEIRITSRTSPSPR